MEKRINQQRKLCLQCQKVLRESENCQESESWNLKRKLKQAARSSLAIETEQEKKGGEIEMLYKLSIWREFDSQSINKKKWVNTSDFKYGWWWEVDRQGGGPGETKMPRNEIQNPCYNQVRKVDNLHVWMLAHEITCHMQSNLIIHKKTITR